MSIYNIFLKQFHIHTHIHYIIHTVDARIQENTANTSNFYENISLGGKCTLYRYKYKYFLTTLRLSILSSPNTTFQGVSKWTISSRNTPVQLQVLRIVNPVSFVALQTGLRLFSFDGLGLLSLVLQAVLLVCWPHPRNRWLERRRDQELMFGNQNWFPSQRLQLSTIIKSSWREVSEVFANSKWKVGFDCSFNA